MTLRVEHSYPSGACVVAIEKVLVTPPEHPTDPAAMNEWAKEQLGWHAAAGGQESSGPDGVVRSTVRINVCHDMPELTGMTFGTGG